MRRLLKALQQIELTEPDPAFDHSVLMFHISIVIIQNVHYLEKLAKSYENLPKSGFERIIAL